MLRTAALVGLSVVGASFVAPLEPVQQRRAAGDRRAVAAPCMVAQPPDVAVARRRDALAAAAALCLFGSAPLPAVASGGATAGKYTTIPIAKRRYFGRVKQGVFEFLQMEAPIFKAHAGRVPVRAHLCPRSRPTRLRRAPTGRPSERGHHHILL